MNSSYDIPDALSRSGLNQYVNSYGAQLRVQDLRAEADAARLARAHRLAHPELTVRFRVAVALRRLADRIAPPHGPAPRPRVVRG